jgi:hypothetical protein
MKIAQYSIFAIVALLTACTTPSERRIGLPFINEQSNKTSKEIAICIGEKWESTQPFLTFSSPPVNTSMRTNGYTVAVTGNAFAGSHVTLVLADIFDYQQGSQIKYYKPAGGGYGDYDKAVMECK